MNTDNPLEKILTKYPKQNLVGEYLTNEVLAAMKEAYELGMVEQGLKDIEKLHEYIKSLKTIQP